MERLKQLDADEASDRIITCAAFYADLGLTLAEYVLGLRSSIVKPTVFMRRSPAERNINNYNPKLLILLGGTNMDFQFVLEAYAAANYISSYMMKTDYRMSRILDQAYAEARRGNMDLQRGIRYVGMALLKGQKISAQEAV